MKKIFWAKIFVPAPLVATTVLAQNKGPGTEAHFRNPPSSFAGRPCHPPPCKTIFGPPWYHVQTVSVQQGSVLCLGGALPRRGRAAVEVPGVRGKLPVLGGGVGAGRPCGRGIGGRE